MVSVRCGWVIASAMLAATSASCTHDFDGLRVERGVSSGNGGGAGTGAGGGGVQGSGASSTGVGSASAGGAGGAPSSGGAGGRLVTCPIRSVTDDFEDGMIDAATWTVIGSTVEETGGVVEITPPDDTANADVRLASVDTFDLRGCSIDVEVVEVLPPSTIGPTTFKAVAAGVENWLRIGVVENSISFSRKVNGFNDYISEDIAYNPVEQRYWRIAEDAGTVSFFTAAESTQWTLQFTAPTPDFASAVKIQLAAGTYMPVNGPGGAQFDNVNMAP